MSPSTRGPGSGAGTRGSTRAAGSARAAAPRLPAARRIVTRQDPRGVPAGRRGDRPNRRRTRPPRRVLRVRVRTVVALAVGVVAVLGAVGWFSPLLSVQSVTVQGERVVSEQQVLSALALPAGTRFAGLDVAAAAARVAAVPRVSSAHVERVLPSSITVTVVERTAVAWLGAADGQHLVDATGVDYAVEAPAPGLPQLVVAAAGAADPATLAALEVLASLPNTVRSLVSTVGASSPAAVQLGLSDGRTVAWGGPDDGARKAAVLTAVLTRPGHSYDVSSPDLPTVR